MSIFVDERMDLQYTEPGNAARWARSKALRNRDEIIRKIPEIRREGENCNLQNFIVELLDLHELALEIRDVGYKVEQYRIQGVPEFSQNLSNEIAAAYESASKAIKDLVNNDAKLPKCRIMRVGPRGPLVQFGR